jgi:hypothetical protein
MKIYNMLHFVVHFNIMRFEVFTVMNIKIMVSWSVALCSLVMFGGKRFSENA